MKISLASSKGWRLREAPFPFQQTYVTPLTDLSRFVHALLAPFEISTAEIWIEQIIFKPEELIDYLSSHGITTDEGALNRAVIHAEDGSEAATLLECVLSQWTDFAFIPSPKKFVIYADHDEFTTVFMASDQLLASLRSDMKLQGFKAVDDWWSWTGPRSPGRIEEGK